MRNVTIIIISILLLFISCQEEECNALGGITITVNDENGIPLQDVGVRIPGVDMQFTDPNGQVSFENLEQGRYSIDLEKDRLTSISPESELFIEITCDGNGEKEFRMKKTGPILGVSISELNFGTQKNVLSLNILNQGIGSFNWEVKNIPSWIEISPTSGTISNNQVPIDVEVLRSQLPLGEHQGEFTIRADNVDAIQVIVIVTIEPPFLIVPNEINFGDDKENGGFDIVLNTLNTVTYQVSSNNLDWVTVNPTSGEIGTQQGQSDNIQVEIDRSMLSFGFHEGTIFIEGNGFVNSLKIIAEKIDPNAPRLEVSHEFIGFGSVSEEFSITVSNTGPQPLIWEASTNVNWLTLGSLDFPSLTQNEPYIINLTADRSLLGTGTFTGELQISSNGGDKTIPINLINDSENIILELGLISHYAFNGNANDSGQFGYVGVPSGVTLAEDRNGNANACYSFDGIDDYINIPNPISSCCDQYSIAFWMKNYSLSSGEKYLLTLRGPTTFDIYLENNSGDNIFNWRTFTDCSAASTTKIQSASVTNQIPTATWTHIVCIHNQEIGNSSYLEIYINGQYADRKELQELSCLISSYGFSTSIGANTQSSGFWAGSIDDFRIYDRALTLNEINLLYCLDNNSINCN